MHKRVNVADNASSAVENQKFSMHHLSDLLDFFGTMWQAFEMILVSISLPGQYYGCL